MQFGCEYFETHHSAKTSQTLKQSYSSQSDMYCFIITHFHWVIRVCGLSFVSLYELGICHWDVNILKPTIQWKSYKLLNKICHHKITCTVGLLLTSSELCGFSAIFCVIVWIGCMQLGCEYLEAYHSVETFKTLKETYSSQRDM